MRIFAFAAISTCGYRFPVPRTAEIAVGTGSAFLADSQKIDRVVFCCFGAEITGAVSGDLDEL